MDNRYLTEPANEREYAMKAAASVDEKPSMLQEASMANDRLLREQSEIIETLIMQLQPVINEKGEGNQVAGDTTPSAGLFAPVTNALLNQGDHISANNRRLRWLLNVLEV